MSEALLRTTVMPYPLLLTAGSLEYLIYRGKIKKRYCSRGDNIHKGEKISGEGR